MPAYAQWLVEGCPEKTVAKVKELAVDEEGKVRKLREIAGEIGTSEKSLADWLYRRGHSINSLLPDDKHSSQPKWLVNGSEWETLKFLSICSEKTYKAMAALLDINPHTLRNWLKGKGLNKADLRDWWVENCT